MAGTWLKRLRKIRGRVVVRATVKDVGDQAYVLSIDPSYKRRFTPWRHAMVVGEAEEGRDLVRLPTSRVRGSPDVGDKVRLHLHTSWTETLADILLFILAFLGIYVLNSLFLWAGWFAVLWFAVECVALWLPLFLIGAIIRVRNRPFAIPVPKQAAAEAGTS